MAAPCGTVKPQRERIKNETSKFLENDSTSQEYIDLDKDSSTVYVVSNSTFQSFEGTLYDFAESGTFPTVDSSTISKVSVDGKDSSYSIEKDENNFWNITENGNTEKADSAKATSLTSAVSGWLQIISH